MIDIIYSARTNRKDDIFMQRRLVQIFTYMMKWGQGTCTLTKHTRRWTYSALRHFFWQFQVLQVKLQQQQPTNQWGLTLKQVNLITHYQVSNSDQIILNVFKMLY